jgi:hypothetical protein
MEITDYTGKRHVLMEQENRREAEGEREEGRPGTQEQFSIS